MASSKEITEARDVPSPVGTALSMAVALKKDHEASKFVFIQFVIS